MDDKSENQPELVLVPRRATKEMLEAAYWEIHGEDGAASWEAMVESWLSSRKRARAK